RGVPLSYPRHSPGPPPRGRDKALSVSRSGDWSGSGSKPRSGLVRAQPVREHRHESKAKRLSPSPKLEPSIKKRRLSSASLSPLRKHSRSRSRGRSPISSSSHAKKDLSSARDVSSLIPQRKVSSSSSKRKSPRVTLHKRFTLDDQETFEIEENVTIAILRKPDAQPSEDVTVKKVFEASQFKMIHKKTEGRKPIFDREEIKVWRHDENLTDDPDYEYRLVRVKSTTGTSKSASNELSRLSPDVVRKTIRLQESGKSNVLASHAEPPIRLDPRPDPRYESRFHQPKEKDDEFRSVKRRDGEKKKEFDDRRGSVDIRGRKEYVSDRKWEDEKREERGKEETYDLRQALERRRSDKEEGFRFEVRRDSVPAEGGYYVDSQQAGPSNVDQRRFPYKEAPGRSVVVDENRARKQFGGSVARDHDSSWSGRRFNDEQGHAAGNRGSLGTGETDGAVREDVADFRDGDSGFDRRRKYSNSPPATRGWRGGYRGRARGRPREFVPFEPDYPLPTVINDTFQYSQHDDRGVSPRPFRRGGFRGRFGPRNFGGKNFRAMTRGSRGGFRGFRGGTRGRGFGSQGDRRKDGLMNFMSYTHTHAQSAFTHLRYNSLSFSLSHAHTHSLHTHSTERTLHTHIVYNITHCQKRTAVL
ncbi:unnamed protein product, partial [Candidula unifasciata]